MEGEEEDDGDNDINASGEEFIMNAQTTDGDEKVNNHTKTKDE